MPCPTYNIYKIKKYIAKGKYLFITVKNVDIEISTQDWFLENVFISVNICS